MNGEQANDSNTQETLTNENMGATENTTGPNPSVHDGGIPHDQSGKPASETEQGQGDHDSKENGRPFWMYWNEEGMDCARRIFFLPFRSWGTSRLLLS
mmetsp:Transcript_2212/g.8705  ORF Transcript_2212/g.8705 Transcript_2212/m.8705 type:complete len:98 (-) Transcript_2212:4963-5256(-)